MVLGRGGESEQGEEEEAEEVMDVSTRRTEARAALSKVLSEYADVFGPGDVGLTMLDSWVIVAQWVEMEEDGNGWTCFNHNSECSWPTRVGLLRIALNHEEAAE